MSVIARVRNSGVGINRGGGLGLEIPVIYAVTWRPKYLVRLDKLINSSESAEQSLGIEVRASSLLKSLEEKGIS